MTNTKTTCKMAECSDGTVGRGFCNKHYLHHKNGTLTLGGVWLMAVAERQHYPKGSICKVAYCERKPHGRGMCHRHFDRFRNGILDKDGRMIRKPQKDKLNPKDSYINNGGYRLLRVYAEKKGPAAYELEHRWVMQKVLGRELKAGEVVHHIDGDKLNNSPSNLELLTISEHPPAHEWTPEMVLQALEALRHNNPQGYRIVMAEQEGLTSERKN